MAVAGHRATSSTSTTARAATREGARPETRTIRGWSSPALREGSGDDAPDHLACLHCPEGVVHALELDGLRHHRGRVQTVRLDELDEAREVAPHLCRAVLAPLHGLLLEEDAERGQRELRVETRHADDDDLAATAREVIGGEDGLREPDHLEGVVRATPAGEGLHLIDRVALRRIDHVGRAELLRGLAFERLGIDRDDATRA